MIKRYLIAVSAVFALGTSVANAQDFQKNYRLGADGTVSVRNVSGDIILTGHDGDAVVVNAFKEGRDRDRVEIEDLSAGNNVDVRARYPERCSNDCNASIRFEVRVPRSIRLNLDKISTASGDIKVTGVQGRVRVNTASGDVLVENVTGSVNASTASGEMRVKDVSGSVNAQSASGDVEVEIARLEGNEDMKFSTASGDVNVKMPADLDAEVEVSSLSGKVETDFPLEIQETRYGPGTKAHGRLGNGSRTLRISTVSGNASLKKG
jgi:DUF4097 and DUF4098 domain-containing protein YvlB